MHISSKMKDDEKQIIRDNVYQVEISRNGGTMTTLAAHLEGGTRVALIKFDSSARIIARILTRYLRQTLEPANPP